MPFSAVGDVNEIAYINMMLPEVMTPGTFQLCIKVHIEGRIIENRWPVFIYPRPVKSLLKIGVYDPMDIFISMGDFFDVLEMEEDSDLSICDIIVTSQLTSAIRKFASAGGNVFFIERGAGYLPVKKVAFWREGMIRRYDHRILDDLEYEIQEDDLRYFSLSTDTAFKTNEFDKFDFDRVVPLLRRYDCREWDATDYMIEIKTGKGTILATTLRFEGGMGKQPIFIRNNPFALWLIDAVFRYLGSKDNVNEQL